MAMNYSEFEEMKRNGFSNVVKWGTYTDTQLVQQMEDYRKKQEELMNPHPTADEMTEKEGGFEAAANSFEEVSDEFFYEKGQDVKDPALEEAAAIAARVEQESFTRIQDDVTKLIRQLEDEHEQMSEAGAEDAPMEDFELPEEMQAEEIVLPEEMPAEENVLPEESMPAEEMGSADDTAEA